MRRIPREANPAKLAYHTAMALSHLGRKDEAAADDGFPCYALFESEPYLDSLKKDPRFIALNAKLKEQWGHYATR